MPIRERARKLFKTKSRGSSISKTPSQEGSLYEGRERWPSNVYKPGEVMPRPKYRAIPKKEHTEKLEAFNFGDSWRKKSFQSTYSPMGTRAPSRRTSFLSFGKKSAASRSASITSVETTKSGRRRQRDGHAALATRLSTEVEQEGDDDVTNVGLSRVQSREHSAVSRPRTAEDEHQNGLTNGLYETKTVTARDHTPFSEQDLALALSRTHLAVPVAT